MDLVYQMAQEDGELIRKFYARVQNLARQLQEFFIWQRNPSTIYHKKKARTN